MPRVGMGGLPVGCFSAAPCRLSTSIYAGRARIARTGPETVGVGGGLVYFKLSPSTRAALMRRHPARWPVKIVVRDASGMRTSSNVQLIPFVTSGFGSPLGAAQPGPLRLIGSTEFVSNGRVGGVLAGCFAAAPCHASLTIIAGGKTIARSRTQMVGVNQLGYVIFSLSNAGHNLLLHTHSNRLGVRLKVTVAGTGSSSTNTTTTTSSSGGAGTGVTGVGVAPSPSPSPSTLNATVNLVSFR